MGRSTHLGRAPAQVTGVKPAAARPESCGRGCLVVVISLSQAERGAVSTVHAAEAHSAANSKYEDYRMLWYATVWSYFTAYDRNLASERTANGK